MKTLAILVALLAPVRMGVGELSTGAALVPRVKRAVQSLDMSACQQLLADIEGLDCASAILEKCEAVARSHYPELM